jgi:hypothetical protein
MATLRRIRTRATRTLFYATASSVATYYFDPQLGPTRRRQLTQWARQLPALRPAKQAKVASGVVGAGAPQSQTGEARRDIIAPAGTPVL